MITDNNYPVLVSLPTELSDEAAAHLVETLLELARVVENHYAAQIRRYHAPFDDRQPDLWDERDPPF